jgi:hypothetical protein
MLTTEEIATAVSSMKRFLKRAERNIRRIDEARRVCRMCHRSKVAFSWSHLENSKCGWHDLCHDCFLTTVDKTALFVIRI